MTPNVGVTYAGSTKKLAEHGGFARDDTNVMLLLSNPSFQAKNIRESVGTAQVAPTILSELGIEPSKLDAVRVEGTSVLPAVQSLSANRELRMEDGRCGSGVYRLLNGEGKGLLAVREGEEEDGDGS